MDSQKFLTAWRRLGSERSLDGLTKAASSLFPDRRFAMSFWRCRDTSVSQNVEHKIKKIRMKFSDSEWARFEGLPPKVVIRRYRAGKRGDALFAPWTRP